MRTLINALTNCKNDKWKEVTTQNMILKQILRVVKHSRKDLHEQRKQQMSEHKLEFNGPFYPPFQNIRIIMESLHILLTLNKKT